jgi:hypothetical protein
MFNPTQIVIAAFIRELRAMYGRTFIGAGLPWRGQLRRSTRS